MPVGVIRTLNQDPFSPVLLSADSVSFAVSDEQKRYIKRVLDTSSSDSKFAQKAYDAITLILTKGVTKEPVVSSLVPSAAEIGDPSFTLHVHGTNFKNTDKIVFAGNVEPTTFVSATELTTGVDMTVWLGPDALPVLIQSADGVLSNAMTFTFTDGSSSALSQGFSAPKVLKNEPKPVEVKEKK